MTRKVSSGDASPLALLAQLGHNNPPSPIDSEAEARDHYLTAAQARARYGGVSDMWLWRRLRDDPDFPRPLVVGSRRIFKLSQLVAWERKLILAKAGRRLNPEPQPALGGSSGGGAIAGPPKPKALPRPRRATRDEEREEDRTRSCGSSGGGQ
jgi:hypothetical protein